VNKNCYICKTKLKGRPFEYWETHNGRERAHCSLACMRETQRRKAKEAELRARREIAAKL